MVKILEKDDPVLRKHADMVSINEITSPKIQRIIGNMKTALHSQEDGVAIAAPQIGHSLRIFVVAAKAFSIMKNKENGDNEVYDSDFNDMVFINPEITKISRKKTWLEEGCLSIRYLYGKVHRAEKASIKAHDERGELFTYGASGLLAQIFQHETDHLDGILFTDKATEIENVPPDKK
jgi:peptide deformylase